MKHFSLFVLALCAAFIPMKVQTAHTLSGSPMGCTSVDYSSGKASATVNTPADAFDGNLKTYYASYDRSYAWVGLDLGEPMVITELSFAPRQGQSQRMVLGVFEGANTEDFSDAIPLYLIDSTPQDGKMNAHTVTCSRGFRYVRYVGPADARCNIAELSFKGYAGVGDDRRLWRPTTLPLITIHVDGRKEINSKSVYLDGWYAAIYDDVDDDGQPYTKIQSDGLRIRGRGNASWDFPKKPYRIKLNEKKHLMGMSAKAKDWTLISNYGDKTLMRNLLAFETSRLLGLAWTPEGRLVDVMLNGEYKGTYQLCDQVEVHNDRVAVTKMDADDNAGDSVQGGYLLEIDAYADKEPVWFTSGTYRIPIVIKYPDNEDITREQKAWVQARWNELEQRMRSKNYADSIEGYPALLDARSFVRHFLVGEYSGNTDTYWSVNIWKDRYDEHFYVGPVWDFDLAFENDGRTHPISSISSFMAQSGVASAANGVKSFISRIISSTADLRLEEWSRARLAGGFTPEHMLALVDSLAKEADDSQRLNFMRWPVLNQRVHQNFQALGSYSKEVDYMKKYVENRFAWLDKKIGLDERYTEVQFMEYDGVEGSVRPGIGVVRLEGWPEGSTVVALDMAGAVLAECRVDDFTTDIELPSGICLIVVTQPSGAVSRVKAFVN